MDKIPTPSGVPAGGGADGAFERFLTAAIATIITIMFSWRLLSDEEQAAMAQASSYPSRASIGFQSSYDRNDLNSQRQQMTHIPERTNRTQVNTSDIDMKDKEPSIEKETTVSSHCQPTNSPDLQASPPPLVQASPPPLADANLINETSDESFADETLTTWDDYKWEEEMDDTREVIHTRRSVKDFINTSKTIETTETESQISESEISPQVSSPTNSFTQRFANFEYRDSGGDSGYIDLYPDVESDDSTSDSEHEYDIQVSDSDSSDDERGGAFFGVTPLDTIVEEESYESDDSYDRKRKLSGQRERIAKENIIKRTENYESQSYDIANTGNIQVTQSSVSESSSYEPVESYLTSDTVSKAGNVNISHSGGHHGAPSNVKESSPSVNDSTEINEQMSNKHASQLELPRSDTNNSQSTFIESEQTIENDTSGTESPFVLHLSKLQNKMKQFTHREADEQKISEISDDSLPPSPIRTCALDNLGDEAFSDTESCSSESVITVLSVRSADSDQYRNIDLDDICDEPLNASVISIMNNGQNTSGNTTSTQTCITDSKSGQIQRENIDPQVTDTSLRNSTNIMYENSVSSSQINGTLGSSENSNSAGSSSTDSLISQENNILNNEGNNQAVNGFDRSRHSDFCNDNEQIGVIAGDNEQRNRFIGSSSSSDSSDPPLREYDPEDDDMAELHFLDSDDDSFYLIVGDEKNLRNFETYQNLNSVGLSPEYGDARTSATVNESAKGFTFSRTEEISTQFRKRTFVTDRCNMSDSDTRSDEPLSPITSEDEDQRSSDDENDGTEKIIVEFDLNKALNPDNTPKCTVSQPTDTYSDALLSKSSSSGALSSRQANDKTENERNIDFNKYIIQADKSTAICSDLDFNQNIDHRSIDDCQSIVEESKFNSGHSKTCIDPKSLQTNSSGAIDINNSDYKGETFSELLDKIERLGHVDGEIQEPNKNSVHKDSVNSDDIHHDWNATPCEKHDIKDKTSLAGKLSRSDPVKKETNVDDIWSADAGIITPNHSNSQETNVDEIFVAERVSPKLAQQKTTSNIKPNKVKIETNVDDLFCANGAEDVSHDQTDTLLYSNENRTVNSLTSVSKIETNVDDILSDSHSSIPLSKELNSSSEKVDSTLRPAECSLSYESFADGLKQQISQNVSDKLLDGNESSNLFSSTLCKNDNTRNTQINSNIILSEQSDPVRKTNKSDKLSFSDKEIIGDYSTDNIHKTESNNYKQYKGEASVTNNFENSNNDLICRTIDQQLKQNNIHNSEVPGLSIQNKIVSNNENINICENYGNNKAEKKETIPSQGIVQSTKDNSNEVKRNSDQILVSTKGIEIDLGSVPTNMDYNVNIHVPKCNDKLNFGVEPLTLEKSSIIIDDTDTDQAKHNVSEKCSRSCDDIELKIVENHDDNSKVQDDEDSDGYSDIKGNTSSHNSSSLISECDSLSDVQDSLSNLKQVYDTSRRRGHSESSVGRVIRTPVIVPSDFKAPKDLLGVKRKIHKTNLKKYTSILQQPITPEKVRTSISIPEKHVPLSRLRIAQSRKQFLSEENLSGSFDEKFLHYRTSLVTSTPRKYLKRHERHLMDMQSTESLPADMSGINSRYGNFSSMEKINYLQYSPRHIEDLYPPGYDSRNSSCERPDYDKLHKDCIFSPQKREEIRHTTESLENMFEQLLRYGSVSSLVETNLDNNEQSEHHVLYDIDISDYVSFQYPLQRAASMSALTGSSDGHRLPRKPGKGRFASRQVPKSKSLQTLETNIDDVFDDEIELGGGMKKTPSVHELRVSKSLSKLTVPDWFKKSSFSRSGSTQSLFTYAGRQSSTSTIGSAAYPPSVTTSPSPSVTPGSNAVIIQKRVTPSCTSSTAKLIRAPLLPTTPEKSPIHPTSQFNLPSEKFRKKEKKDLKPIAIVPFAKIREMFERGTAKVGANKKNKSPVKSPVKETQTVRFETISPKKETVIDERISEPVQNHTSGSPPPLIPERKPILTERDRTSESVQHNHNNVQNTHQRRAQVHFSDEEDHVSKSQEQNSNSVRKPQKPQSIKTSLPMPQFRFRRPANVKPVSLDVQSTQSKKGKECYFHDNFVNAALHALQYRAKIDGEHLFEFLQRRRYSSLLENGFAEQMDDLQDKEVRFNFPVLAIGKHSISGTPRDGNEELQVILTNTCLNKIQNGELNGLSYTDASLEEVVEGLLTLREHRSAMLAMEGNRSIPRFQLSDDDPSSPESPPLTRDIVQSSVLENGITSVYEKDDLETDYVLVTCDNPVCKRETNLKEARKYFKTCHSCFTYYCSRSCRKEHWEAHKKVCVFSRINSACKHVIKAVNRDPHMQYQCSRLARRGYLSRGRGCIIFAFPDISSTEDFLYFGMECLWVPPVYVCLKELSTATMLGTNLEILTQTCNQYNPELKYVIHVAIVIPQKLPSRPVPRKKDSIIQKCAKLRLSPAHMHPKPSDSPTDNPTTMILTAVPGNKHEHDQDGRKARELCFINIQRKLRQRGISLRHHYPNVYNRLIDFVSDAKHFSPLIIYPTDSRTGKRFMCVIMPESEPEIEWIRDPDLFQELDVFDEEDFDLTPPPDFSPMEVTDTFV